MFQKRFQRPIALLLVVVIVATSGCAAAPAPTPPAAPVTPTTTSTGSGTTVVAVSPPANQCCPHPTLWEFLGVKALFKGIGTLGNRLRNRLGSRFPGLEAKPEVLAITDPKNLDSPNPAVKSAAGVKADEDAAPQKAKAIKYLASIGCAGCYPDVQDALLAALDDCTESVRYEAVNGLRNAAGKPCATCKSTSCCSEKVRKKLDKIANEMNDQNCYKESSARVRRVARLALAGCGGGAVTVTAPIEGPSEGPADKSASAAAAGETKMASAHTEALTSEEIAAAEAEAKDPAKAQAHRQEAVSVLLKGSDCNCGHGSTTSVLRVNVPAAEKAKAAPAEPKGRIVNEPTLAKPAKGEVLASAQQPINKPAAARPTARKSAPAGVVLARVNGDLIFEAEINAIVDRKMADSAPIEPLEREMQIRQFYMRQQLQVVIDRKLVCQQARQALPGNEIETVGYEASSGDGAAMAIPVTAPQAYVSEESLAAKWLARAVRISDLVPRPEIDAYYHSHIRQYQQEAKIRGQRLIAPLDKFASHDDAYAALMYLRRRTLGQQPGNPPQGNLKDVKLENFDWKKASEFDATESTALFTAPAGEFGPIVTESNQLSISRVLERSAPTALTLEQVSAEIRSTLLAERRVKAEIAYIDQLRQQAQVWTIFDDATPRARAVGVKAP